MAPIVKCEVVNIKAITIVEEFLINLKLVFI